MKKIIKQVSFEEANQLIDMEKMYLHSKENTFSRSLQLFILALFCGFMSLLTLKNSIIITSVLILIIAISYFLFFHIKFKNKAWEEFSWQLVKYLMLQTITVSIVLGVRINDGKPFGDLYILFAFCYLIFIVILSYLRCKAMMLNYLRKNGMDLKESSVSKIWNKGIFKLSIGLLVAIILGTQLYRVSKFLFIGSNSSPGEITIQNEWLGGLLVVVIGLVLVIFFIVFSLLPTLFFNAKVITEGILLKEYEDEFRKEFDLVKDK
ncbi:hypothetical protein [Listeria kieliensis]|uniref:Membrane protein n=1 Tax=Listeria kieliensis TaxID=1621700 RepID=A0A3D8TQZ4_9LIST|nr:hypothetical protein [Listeria kieliensis]RDX01220.1 membrane protein [Listeria kieliensis]